MSQAIALRSDSTNGLWVLVGESAVPTFVDTLVERGKSYCDAIQAYNLNVFSAQGPATCAELPLIPIARLMLFFINL